MDTVKKNLHLFIFSVMCISFATNVFAYQTISNSLISSLSINNVAFFMTTGVCVSCVGKPPNQLIYFHPNLK